MSYRQRSAGSTSGSLHCCSGKQPRRVGSGRQRSPSSMNVGWSWDDGWKMDGKWMENGWEPMVYGGTSINIYGILWENRWTMDGLGGENLKISIELSNWCWNFAGKFGVQYWYWSNVKDPCVDLFCDCSDGSRTKNTTSMIEAFSVELKWLWISATKIVTFSKPQASSNPAPGRAIPHLQHSPWRTAKLCHSFRIPRVWRRGPGRNSSARCSKAAWAVTCQQIPRWKHVWHLQNTSKYHKTWLASEERVLVAKEIHELKITAPLRKCMLTPMVFWHKIRKISAHRWSDAGRIDCLVTRMLLDFYSFDLDYAPNTCTLLTGHILTAKFPHFLV